MAFAITESCCSDASCVSVCPVGCIHPAPGEPGFGTSEILHIDPAVCIDCGACADACPVDAIYPVDRLVGDDADFAEVNAAHFTAPKTGRPAAPPTPEDGGHPAGLEDFETPPEGEPGAAERSGGDHRHDRDDPAPWAPMPPGGHVAIVGAGASGLYTLKELLARTDACITVIDALPTPGGLIRSGVAADHPATKRIQRTFDVALRHRRVRLTAGAELGRDVSLAELRERFDAVFVATGANVPRTLGVPGETHPRVRRARDVVAWAGGVPGADSVSVWPVEGHDHSNGTRRATAPADGAIRVVIVGTGNVALDLARLFTIPVEALARTDVADRAISTLRAQRVDEVVLLGRGAAAHAAYTQAEFKALAHLTGVDVRVIDADEPWDAEATHTGDRTPRITFVFGAQVKEFTSTPHDAGAGSTSGAKAATGASHAGVRVAIERPGIASGVESSTLDAALAITSLGQDVGALEGLPLDPRRRTVEHVAGRVTGLPGVYVVGWAKRGAVGGIGANRTCAAETVASYLLDAPALPAPSTRRPDLARLLGSRGVRLVDGRGARRIDRIEVRNGAETGRPRVKMTDRAALLSAASSRMGGRSVSPR